jgi:hypothetical protein
MGHPVLSKTDEDKHYSRGRVICTTILASSGLCTTVISTTIVRGTGIIVQPQTRICTRLCTTYQSNQ